MKRIAVAATVALLLASCSSKQPEAAPEAPKQSPPQIARPAKPAVAEAADFEVTAAWRLKKVVLKPDPEMPQTPPSPTFTISVKPGTQLVAVELSLRPNRATDPGAPNLVVIGPDGSRHQRLFWAPKKLATYNPGADSVAMFNHSGLSGKKVSEVGGKLVAVFEMPAGQKDLQLEINEAPAIPVNLK